MGTDANEIEPKSTNEFKPPAPTLTVGSPGQWKISHAGESCSIAELEGLTYIYRILANETQCEFVWTTGTKSVQRELPVLKTAQVLGCSVNSGDTDGDDLLPEDDGEVLPDDLGAISAKRLDKTTHELTEQAKAALRAGVTSHYDALQLQIIAVRRYKSETIGLHGRRRKFADESSRSFDAVRKAIERAVRAIKKPSPKIAAHLREHVCGWNGKWFYDGGVEWDTVAQVATIETCSEPEKPENIRLSRRNRGLALEIWRSMGRPRPLTDLDDDPVAMAVKAILLAKLK